MFTLEELLTPAQRVDILQQLRSSVGESLREEFYSLEDANNYFTELINNDIDLELYWLIDYLDSRISNIKVVDIIEPWSYYLVEEYQNKLNFLDDSYTDNYKSSEHGKLLVEWYKTNPDVKLQDCLTKFQYNGLVNLLHKQPSYYDIFVGEYALTVWVSNVVRTFGGEYHKKLLDNRISLVKFSEDFQEWKKHPYEIQEQRRMLLSTPDENIKDGYLSELKKFYQANSNLTINEIILQS